jgi:hypothetical protein
MGIRQFVKEHRTELDEHIRLALKGNLWLRLNDSERVLWVLNDETLYNFARRCGVKI